MGGEYKNILDAVPGAMMSVEFRTVKGSVVGYPVVLTLAMHSGVETIRIYDATHGFNEMHRYTRTRGKQDGVVFHRGTLSEGMQAAIDAVKRIHLEMIEGWRGDEKL